jgi:hypothetical protein
MCRLKPLHVCRLLCRLVHGRSMVSGVKKAQFIVGDHISRNRSLTLEELALKGQAEEAGPIVPSEKSHSAVPVLCRFIGEVRKVKPPLRTVPRPGAVSHSGLCATSIRAVPDPAGAQPHGKAAVLARHRRVRMLTMLTRGVPICNVSE